MSAEYSDFLRQYLTVAIFAPVVYHFEYDRGLALLLAFGVIAIGLFRFATREFMLAAGIVIFTYALTTLMLVLFKPSGPVTRERSNAS